TPHNFIFFGLDRARIHEPAFLHNSAVPGAQLKYSWKELEPAQDHYDFAALKADLEFLDAHGKKLFVQVQDATFDDNHVSVPDYLRHDPAFHGGVARKYSITRDDESTAAPAGWVARRWDPAVRARFGRLLAALGKEFDGRVEGINVPETSIDFGESGKLHPDGFTYASYVDGVKEIMSAAKAAFPHSAVIQYANFMPGEWLPWSDHGYLKAVYAHANAIGVGVGGPDLLPHRKGQQNHSYPLIAARAPSVIAGIAVQDGNLEDKDPGSGRVVTVDELYRFARDQLHVDYIFWGTQEPYYSRDILPYLEALPRR
ncbi:MAG TPA: hypothetical protein VJS69_04040, partial [Candidatus Krumholzibacteria bacterium]|nr:hypothetical protein [Candidatus Krumholzibacteria bacterium]